MQTAVKILVGFAYSAIPISIRNGAEPWTASNIAYSLPIFADPAVPTPPWICAASSVMISPYRLGKINTSKSDLMLLFIRFAAMISIYQSLSSSSG